MSINFPIMLVILIVSVFSSKYEGRRDCDLSKVIDGTYDFTALSEDFQINICTNDAGESYMSINAINPDGLVNANYVFGAFRDLDGVREIKPSLYGLVFTGFQIKPPLGIEFEAMTYKFTVNTDTNRYQLSRDYGNEVFVLDKRSMTPLTNCFEPGNYDEIEFPAFYVSTDLVGSGLCASPDASCFYHESISDAGLTDSCFAFVTSDNTAYSGGVISSQDIKWGGLLSLQSWTDTSIADGGCCASGSEIVIASPKEANKKIITGICSEGYFGSTFELTKINKLCNVPSCPLFTP